MKLRYRNSVKYNFFFLCHLTVSAGVISQGLVLFSIAVLAFLACNFHSYLKMADAYPSLITPF